MSFFLSLFRRPKLDEQTREALLAYLKPELHLIADQTAASERYNATLSRYLSVVPSLDTSSTEIPEWQAVVDATSEYLDEMREIVERHQSLRPPPEASEFYAAQDLAYRGYVRWCENRLLSYRNIGNLSPEQERVIAESDRDFERVRKAGDRAKGKMIRMLGLSMTDILEMQADR